MSIFGLYSAASGMEAQQTLMDAVGNDISNIDTPGYQGTVVGFHDLLYSQGGDDSGSTVANGAGAGAQQIGYDQTQGAIQQTGNPLDVAISGPGFLQVTRPDGTIGLTRNGTLQVNASGQLTTDTGMPLQPPITLPKGVDPSQLNIASDGTITSGSGQKIGQIQLVDVTSPNGLIADGDSLYSATAASGPIKPATGATLQQGALTQSNVDLAADMSKMIEAQQSYDMASKAISYQDQMLQIANQIRA